MSDELKPCPFCFSNDVAIHEHYTGSSYMAMCHNCTAEGPLHDTRVLAAEWWNRRAAPAAELPLLDDAKVMDEYARIVAYPERLTSGDYATAIKLAQWVIAPYADRIRHLGYAE